MVMEHTLSIIKPNAVKKNLIGTIIQRFEQARFEVSGLKIEQLTREKAEGFYAEHKGKPFFEALVAFMTSGPVVLIALSGEDVIRKYRDLIGATDPTKALAGTIRYDFADSLTENAVHGSDSIDSAKREIAYFFNADELLRGY